MFVDGDLVTVFASLFVHCWSHYAVQQRDGSYWRIWQDSAHLARISWMIIISVRLLSLMRIVTMG